MAPVRRRAWREALDVRQRTDLAPAAPVPTGELTRASATNMPDMSGTVDPALRIDCPSLFR
jgi:hypothetical protein